MGILVRNGGILTTVQDLGRTGYQQFGVPVSGAVDPRSLALANLLVDNDEGEAGLEITMLGPQLEFTESNVIAVTGGDLSPQLNGASIENYRALSVKKGDVLSFGMPKTGCRAYLAFAGGLEIEPVMGSRSTYLKAKMGGHQGRRLQPNDEIGFRAPKTTLKNLADRQIKPEDFSAKEKRLRVILGPQDDCFTEIGKLTFFSTPYTVTDKSDRMGCRLDGNLVEHIKDGNIISDGIAFGAVQVPGEGKPIIMLSDRQTTGGYTKIANVITADLPLIAQAKAGDCIRFEAVDIHQAQNLYLSEQKRYAALRAEFSANRPAPVAPAAAPIAVPSPAASGVFRRSYTVSVNGHSYEVLVEHAD